MNKGEFQKLRLVLRHILENESRVRTAVFERLAERSGQVFVLEATALFMLAKKKLTTTALVPTAVLSDRPNDRHCSPPLGPSIRRV